MLVPHMASHDAHQLLALFCGQEGTNRQEVLCDPPFQTVAGVDQSLHLANDFFVRARRIFEDRGQRLFCLLYIASQPSRLGGKRRIRCADPLALVVGKLQPVAQRWVVATGVRL